MQNKKKIKKYLETYSHIWDVNGQYDIVMELISDSVYGIDFSTHPIYQIFFRGGDDFFPAIIPITKAKLDECPIYDFDLGDNDGERIQYIGNFKTFIKELLEETEKDLIDDNVSEDYSQFMSKKAYLKDIKHAKRELESFSDIVLPIEIENLWGGIL
jgi:hypothetical protein